MLPRFIWLDLYNSRGLHFSGYAQLTNLGYVSDIVPQAFNVREAVVNKEAGPMGCWLSMNIDLAAQSRLVIHTEDFCKAVAQERQEERQHATAN